MDSSVVVLGRILDAATEEFGHKGFSGAKVDAIARRAGVNKAGLYYHAPPGQAVHGRRPRR